MLGGARRCSEVLGGARRCSEVLGAARSCSEGLGGARRCSEVLGGARRCSEVLGGARKCSGVLGAARSCSEVLGGARPSWEKLISSASIVCSQLRRIRVEPVVAIHCWLSFKSLKPPWMIQPPIQRGGPVMALTPFPGRRYYHFTQILGSNYPR